MPDFARKATQHERFAAKRALAGLLLYCVLPVGSVAIAEEADPALMAEGLRIYKTKAECDGCHGWTGRSGQYDDDPNYQRGPSLVQSTLGRDRMIELISCGTPGDDMPRYLAGAWTEARPCYGKIATDLPPEGLPPAPYTVLQPSQIEAVVRGQKSL